MQKATNTRRRKRKINKQIRTTITTAAKATTMSRRQLLASERELSGDSDSDDAKVGADVEAEAEAKALGARKHAVFKLQSLSLSGDQFKFVRRATHN